MPDVSGMVRSGIRFHRKNRPTSTESDADRPAGPIWIDDPATLEHIDLSSGDQPPRRAADGLHVFPPVLRMRCLSDLRRADRCAARSIPKHLQHGRFEMRLPVLSTFPSALVRAVADLVPRLRPLPPPLEGPAAGDAALRFLRRGHDVVSKSVRSASIGTAVDGSRRIDPAAAMPLSIACSTLPPRHQSPATTMPPSPTVR